MDKLKTYTYCIPSKINSKGEAPIRVRISVNGEFINLSTGLYINKDFWDKKKAKVKSKHPKASHLNKQIRELEEQIYKIWEDLKYQGELISVQRVKELLRNKSKIKMGLIQLIDFQIDYIKQRLDKQYSLSTLKQFGTLKNKIEKFLSIKYACNDLDIEKLNYEFITRFEAYLTSVDKNSMNTTSKYVTRLRTVINVAIKNQWLKVDPFAKYKGKNAPSNRQFLTSEELARIEKLDLTESLKLEMVRDTFMFMSYTGLSYCDMESLKKDNIVIGINGMEFLTIERGKTKQRCTIPLFEKSKHLITKYQAHPICLNKNRLFPVISNQKTNFYLKEIGEKAGVSKPLTCHIARHSFATISLENQVPMETLSKVLGHSSIRTTQIYGKITNTKIEFDYQNMANMFGKSSTNEIIYPQKAI